MTTTTYVNQLAQDAVKQCREDYRPVEVIENDFGGFDLRDERGRVMRIAQEDPERGVELYVLSPNGICRNDCRFGAGFPIDVVAMVVPNAFLA